MVVATAPAPLAPQSALPRRHTPGPRILALLPAHNEAAGIGAALASLHAQTTAASWTW